MSSTNAAKYDMRINPMYQVDCQNATTGKRVSATKRRVRFRFGFSNAETISKGMTGMNCRGEEHEISLVWSLTSGKRLVFADGEEVHYSKGKRTDIKFETSWTMCGGHVIKLVAHAAPPLKADFRQFDLLVDGCSFFDMPRIFELGVVDAVSKTTGISALLFDESNSYNNYSLTSLPEENAWAYKTSSVGRRHSAPSIQQQHKAAKSEPVSRSHSMPRDMLSDPTMQPQDHLSAPVALLDQANSQSHAAFVVERRATHEPPSFQNEIMTAYGPPAAPAYQAAAPAYQALASGPHMHTQRQQPVRHHQSSQPFAHVTSAPPQQPMVPPGASFTTSPAFAVPANQYASPQTYDDNTVPSAAPSSGSETGSPIQAHSVPITPTMMAPLSLDDDGHRDQPELTSSSSPVESAMRSLVNLEDITEMKETPEQVKSKEKKQSTQPFRSTPKPPTTPEWHLGRRPSLIDIKQHASPKAASKKEIMRTHAFDPAAVQAGMLVVYNGGAPATTQYGLPVAAGFGAGVHPPHYHGSTAQQQHVYAAY